MRDTVAWAIVGTGTALAYSAILYGIHRLERHMRRRARQRQLAEELSRRVHDPDTGRAWDRAQQQRRSK